jgi:hypothetical protein
MMVVSDHTMRLNCLNIDDKCLGYSEQRGMAARQARATSSPAISPLTELLPIFVALMSWLSCHSLVTADRWMGRTVPYA